MMASGGRGLSLSTDLINASIGDELRKVFDPAVFYDDEELGKCVDLPASGIALSGQGRPQGTKRRLMLHLWKQD